jgi:S-adenosylmethionine:diacylglycerol 3-amino-3-carboxypropyl transferase
MLYYSHVNEDNSIERELLQTSGCRAVAAVAGSGERLIALLDYEPCTEFHAIDTNEEALFLLQLKLAALESLSIEDYWQFNGHHIASAEMRKECFARIADKLSPACKKYWKQNMGVIETGIVNAGHFEKFLGRVRPSVNLFLGNKFISVLSDHSPYSRDFPKRKWKLITQIFSLKWIYKLWGNKDLAFVGKGADIARIPAALDQIVYNGEAASCFMAHLIFNGHLREMKEKSLPLSLQKNLLQKVKQRLLSSELKVNYHHTDILTFARENVSNQMPLFYSLSDILSFESRDYLGELLNKIAVPGNTIVWRTFLRNRVNGDKKHDDPYFNYEDVADHSPAESTRMYQVFSIQKPIHK